MKGSTVKSSRLIPLLVIPIAVTFSLSGCLAGLIPQPSAPIAVPTFDQETEPPLPEESDIPVPDDAVPDDTVPEDTAAPAAPTDGTIAEPGATAGPGESLAYEFTGTDDVKAIISATLLDITPATDAQVASLNELAGDDSLKGYNIVLIHVQETKVSGDPVEFNADYTGFKPIDAKGTEISSPSVIGWEDCESESFTDEFDAGSPITQCLLAVYPEGANEPAGVNYSQYDTPYDSYDGKPLLFLNS